MMTVGLGVVGSTYSFASEYQLQDATPLAQLMSEPEGILVPGDSPYETVDDLVQAWKDDPGSIAVGGGSSPGGPDHLFPMQLADEIGVDPNDVNYVSYDGGGPLTSALLGEKIDVGFSGLAEFVGQVESGELRVLAVSGEERYPDGTVRRRADADRVRHRPGVPQLARRARPARDQRGAHRGADRLPRGDARQPGLAGRARGERLDRRLQDRRRVRRRSSTSRTSACPGPSRSWGCCERRPPTRPSGDRRQGPVRPRGRSPRWSASTRSSTRAASPSASATRSARGCSRT